MGIKLIYSQIKINYYKASELIKSRITLISFGVWTLQQFDVVPIIQISYMLAQIVVFYYNLDASLP